MKTALVCGAGGFIGGHLVKKLKREGYWVRGVDIKEHEFAPTQTDEFMLLDLRQPESCQAALTFGEGTFDEVYQLAADMGGMGFIHSAECDIMHNSALINIHMTHNASELGVPRYFFSFSVCVQSRNLSNERIYSTGWKSRFYLKDGIFLTYPWIDEQMKARRTVAYEN